ncbi:MAG: hypothetical protein KC931_24885, partial [Candidatus Omnitrophica bacterium]|nr:hypothetical protein [Candidatus Omnitrophota bacterium]
MKLQSDRATIEPDAQALANRRRSCETDIRILDEILTLKFDQIDGPGALHQLGEFQARRTSILAPDSEATTAKAAYESAKKQTEDLRSDFLAIERRLAVLGGDIARAERELGECLARQGNPLTQEESDLAKLRLGTPDTISETSLDRTEREVFKSIDHRIEKRTENLRNLEKRLVSLMEKARVLNEGAYADVGADLDSIPAYLEELKILVEESLPEKEKRFLEYLNRSSDQGVTQLLAHIDQEVSEIEERITDLNHTLAKVDFRQNHYLQLHLKRLDDLAIRDLERARRHLRDAVLKEDEGRSHFRALQEIVKILREAGNNRHLVGSRALLDPRYRIEFQVVEVDRETGRASSGRSGSQSGSGGEKELMSSHILTASLSYALCPTGESRPLYGTIILDEAFS